MKQTPTPLAKSDVERLIDTVLLVAIALMPVTFALVTFEHYYIKDLMVVRAFALPTMVVELFVVVIGLARVGSVSAVLRPLGRSLVIILAIVVAIAVVGSFIAANNLLFTVSRTVVNILHLLFGLTLAALLSSAWAERRKFLYDAMHVCWLIFPLLVGVFVMTIPDESSFDWKGFGLASENIRNVGGLSMIGASFCLALAMTSHSRRALLAWVASTLNLAVIFWSGTRGGYFGYIFAAVALFVLIGLAFRWRHLLLLIVTNIAAGLISLIHIPPHPAYGLIRFVVLDMVSGIDSVATGRLELWMITLDRLWVMPILGYGESQFTYEIFTGGARFSFPHNIVLQLWYQWGWIGGTLALLLLAIATQNAFFATRKMPIILAAPFAGLAALLAYSMLDGPFYIVTQTSLIATFYAILLRAKWTARANPAVAKRNI